MWTVIEMSGTNIPRGQTLIVRNDVYTQLEKMTTLKLNLIFFNVLAIRHTRSAHLLFVQFSSWVYTSFLTIRVCPLGMFVPLISITVHIGVKMCYVNDREPPVLFEKKERQRGHVVIYLNLKYLRNNIRNWCNILSLHMFISCLDKLI
jgi:hypothetical protein